MALFLVQGGQIVQVIHRAVNLHTHKAGLGRVVQQLGVLALARAHHWRQDQQARILRHLQDGVHHLVHRLLADLHPALGAVGDADARVEQAQVVVDLCHRAHGGARVVPGCLLINRNRGREAVNGVHIRLFHLPQKLAGIAGHAFHIAALAFGINSVKGQRGLAGARQACKYN